MSKSYRYCIKCKDEVQFTWTDGDPVKYRKDKDFTSKGWFCCTCDWKLDERKVRHIEAKLDLEHEINSRLNSISEIQKEINVYQEKYLKKYGVKFEE